MISKQTRWLLSGMVLAGLMIVSPLIVQANENLETKVKTAVHEHKHVKVEVKGQDVILRGHVNTQAEKQKLESQVHGVPGVAHVRDEVTVEHNKAEHSKADAVEDYIEDADISAKVKTKILATKGLDSLDIHVKTDDGVVTLSGKVKKVAEIELAGKVAHEVKGVKKVVNMLSVAAKK